MLTCSDCQCDDKCAERHTCPTYRIIKALETIAVSLAILAERQEITSELTESVKLYTPAKD
jgi:hypothetical protein